MAKEGSFVTGIETNLGSYLMADAIRRNLGLYNLAYYNLPITPNNIYTLPNYDYVILLNVFHHWNLEYGDSKSDTMLEELWIRTNNIMFICFNIAEKYQNTMSLQKYLNPRDWIKEYFYKRSAKNIEFSQNNSRHLAAVIK